MTMTCKSILSHRRHAALVAALVALAYSAIPTLGALHGVHHFGEQLAAAAPTTERIAAGVARDAEASGACEICQAAARSKHTGALAFVRAVFVHEHDERPLVSRRDTGCSIGLAPRSTRAPPRA